MPTAAPKFVLIPQQVPLPGGEFRLLPGKPVQWAGSRLAAQYLGVDGSTLRKWIADGTLPKKFKGEAVYRRRGVKFWEFNLPVVDLIKERWMQTPVQSPKSKVQGSKSATPDAAPLSPLGSRLSTADPAPRP